MLKLYHNGHSSCAQKVRLVLAEKDLQMDRDWISHELHLLSMEQKNPEYLEINPKGVVPSLIHDDKIVLESSTISQYIDDTFDSSDDSDNSNGVSLTPNDPDQRKTMQAWIDLQDSEGFPSIAAMTIGLWEAQEMIKQRDGGGESNDAMALMADEDLMKRLPSGRSLLDASGHFADVLAQLDESLSEQSFISGNSISLADTSWLPFAVRMEHLNLGGIMIDPLPGLSAWYERMKARPSYKTAIVDWTGDEWNWDH